MSRVATTIALTAFLAIGCVVTDTLEFEDLVNHPPEVVEIVPANSTIMWVCNDEYALTLKVWDPDADDVGTYDAKVYLWPNPYVDVETPIEKGLCSTKQHVPGDDSEEAYETGAIILVNCSLDLNFLGGVNEDDIMLAKVVVSDRQFIQQSLPNGAHTAEVFWTLQLAPDDSCEEQ